jgi:hypothetical protein
MKGDESFVPFVLLSITQLYPHKHHNFVRSNQKKHRILLQYETNRLLFITWLYFILLCSSINP